MHEDSEWVEWVNDRRVHLVSLPLILQHFTHMSECMKAMIMKEGRQEWVNDRRVCLICVSFAFHSCFVCTLLFYANNILWFVSLFVLSCINTEVFRLIKLMTRMMKLLMSKSGELCCNFVSNISLCSEQVCLCWPELLTTLRSYFLSDFEERWVMFCVRCLCIVCIPFSLISLFVFSDWIDDTDDETSDVEEWWVMFCVHVSSLCIFWIHFSFSFFFSLFFVSDQIDDTDDEACDVEEWWVVFCLFFNFFIFILHLQLTVINRICHLWVFNMDPCIVFIPRPLCSFLSFSHSASVPSIVFEFHHVDLM